MRKEKNKENESGDNLNIDRSSLPLETDQEIQEQINKRKDENQALKKLLENLNTSFTKQEMHTSRSKTKNS